MELLTREKVEFDKINICSGIATSGNDILKMLKEISGYSPEIQISNVFVRKNEVWRLVGSNERLLEFLGDKEFKGYEIYKILNNMYNSCCKELILQNV